MNILALEDGLKSISDQDLAKELRAPSGIVPQFMVLTELNRRKDIRQNFMANQAQPKSNIAQEFAGSTGGSGLAALGMQQPVQPAPPQGGAPPGGMPPPGGAPPGMPPPGMRPQGAMQPGAMPPAPPSQMPRSPTQPTRPLGAPPGMAEGGEVQASSAQAPGRLPDRMLTNQDIDALNRIYGRGRDPVEFPRYEQPPENRGPPGRGSGESYARVDESAGYADGGEVDDPEGIDVVRPRPVRPPADWSGVDPSGPPEVSLRYDPSLGRTIGPMELGQRRAAQQGLGQFDEPTPPATPRHTADNGPVYRRQGPEAQSQSPLWDMLETRRTAPYWHQGEPVTYAGSTGDPTELPRRPDLSQMLQRYVREHRRYPPEWIEGGGGRMQPERFARGGTVRGFADGDIVFPQLSPSDIALWRESLARRHAPVPGTDQNSALGGQLDSLNQQLITTSPGSQVENLNRQLAAQGRPPGPLGYDTAPGAPVVPVTPPATAPSLARPSFRDVMPGGRRDDESWRPSADMSPPDPASGPRTYPRVTDPPSRDARARSDEATRLAAVDQPLAVPPDQALVSRLGSTQAAADYHALARRVDPYLDRGAQALADTANWGLNSTARAFNWATMPADQYRMRYDAYSGSTGDPTELPRNVMPPPAAAPPTGIAAAAAASDREGTPPSLRTSDTATLDNPADPNAQVPGGAVSPPGSPNVATSPRSRPSGSSTPRGGGGGGGGGGAGGGGGSGGGGAGAAGGGGAGGPTRERSWAEIQRLYGAGDDPLASIRDQMTQDRADLARSRDHTAGLALMRAGLGIMSSRSPNLGIAIGEGGTAGLTDYQQQSEANRRAGRELTGQQAQVAGQALQDRRAMQQLAEHGYESELQRQIQREQMANQLRVAGIHAGAAQGRDPVTQMQNNAHFIATNEGLQPGTPEYQRRMAELVHEQTRNAGSFYGTDARIAQQNSPLAQMQRVDEFRRNSPMVVLNMGNEVRAANRGISELEVTRRVNQMILESYGVAPAGGAAPTAPAAPAAPTVRAPAQWGTQ
jgi:hypothetical protein